jgi:hypothetical protein
MTVLIYVDTSKQVGDPDHLRALPTPRRRGLRKTIPKGWLCGPAWCWVCPRTVRSTTKEKICCQQFRHANLFNSQP